MRKWHIKKLTKEGKILFISLIIFILVIIVIFNSCEKEETKVIENDIVNTSEIDTDVINTIFADGMNTKDYKNILNYIPTKLISGVNYNKINYEFEKTLHYNDIEALINEMNKSDIVNVYIIGKSHDNRNIYDVEIGKGDKILMLDANMHAAESANAPILTKFLIDILNDYENNDNEVVELLNKVKIVAIPCINPDGYEIYNFGVDYLNNKKLWIYQDKDNVFFDHFKYNANGVDLNRNFPTQNAGLYYNEYKLISSVSLSKTTQRHTYFGGNTLGSEPEVRAVMYQILSHYKDTYAYVNIHSQGRVIYSGKPNLSDEYNNLTIELCNRMSTFNKYKVHGLDREEIGEGNDGTASDFMAELVNGFIFSSKTGRLSSNSYKNNNSSLKYHAPAVVLETMNDNYKDPSKYKDEYYNHGLKEMFYDLVRYVNERE
ncbi:MAG: hypothetical protein IJK67_02760 [Bacilli bacterium]|nr:hypothetical protein [Bacilli bacterium]